MTMIADLRHDVTIETPTDAVDAIGGQTVTWATHASVKAQIKPAKGSERYFGQKLEANVSHKVRIRYLATVTTSMRVIYGSRTLQVRAVMHEEERFRWTDLLCEEGVAS